MNRARSAARIWTAALILVTSCAGAAAASDAADPIDALVRAEMERQKIPGLALAVVEHGQVTKAQGYGLANVELRVPVGGETIFQSGSLGKQFTAALVMTLVEAGQVGLDDSIRKYFPDAPR